MKFARPDDRLRTSSRLGHPEGTGGNRTRRRFALVAVALFSILGFASCDWTQFGLNATHSGNNFETTISTSNVSNLRLLFAATGASTSPPAIANGVVYTSGGNHLWAFDAVGKTNCTGVPVWCSPLWTATISTGSDVQSSPAVYNGVVYVGSDNGKLYAFDAAGNTNCSGVPKTCAPLWTGSTGGSLFSSPAVVNGVLYIGSEDGKLYAFDPSGTTNCSGAPKTCAPLWTAQVGTGAGVYASPAVANGIVYVGSQTSGGLDAFDAAGNTNCSGVPKQCAALWTYDTGDTSSSAAVINGVLFVGDFLANVRAFDAAGKVNCSGAPSVCEPLWSAHVNSTIGVSQSPAVAYGTVYVGDQCNFGFPSFNCANPPHFYAFDAATGSTRWTAMASSTDIPSTASVANGLVFVGTSNGVSAYDAAGIINCSGTPIYCSPLWTASPPSGQGDGAPVVANGMVYVGSGDGNLYVYGLPA